VGGARHNLLSDFGLHLGPPTAAPAELEIGLIELVDQERLVAADLGHLVDELQERIRVLAVLAHASSDRLNLVGKPRGSPPLSH